MVRRITTGTLITFTDASAATPDIAVNAGGTIANGSAADTTATIFGATGIYGANDPVFITNFGTIIASQGVVAGTQGYGIDLTAGGSVANANDTATIIGYAGIAISGGAGTVTNLGNIVATGPNPDDTAIALSAGGSVSNGSDANTAAAIVGAYGVDISGGTGIVTNFATIAATGTAAPAAVYLAGGGAIVNGSSTDSQAVIVGTQAILVTLAPGYVTNFGTIAAAGSTAIDLAAGGTVVNAGTIAAVGGGAISAALGVPASGNAITLGAGGNPNLVVDVPGAAFFGTVTSAGPATLELAPGASLGATGGLGSQFTGFDTLAVDPGAAWALTGTNTVATVSNSGDLALAPGASLDVTGALDAAGTGNFLLFPGSTFEVNAAPSSTATMTFLAPATLIIDHAASFGTGSDSVDTLITGSYASYTGPTIENFTAGDTIDLTDLLFFTSTSPNPPFTSESTQIVDGFDPTTGILQLTSQLNIGGEFTLNSPVGALKFDTATLSSTNFHLQADSNNHPVITLT